MNKKELLLIKQELEKRQIEIKDQLDSIVEKEGGHDNVKFPQFGQAEDENASEVEAYSNILSLKNNLEESLSTVENALKKIAKGNYGLCEHCGQEISSKRLKAVPTARLCLACEKKLRG